MQRAASRSPQHTAHGTQRGCAAKRLAVRLRSGLCAVCCALCAASAASAASLQVQVGLGGHARRGRWAPIRVAVAGVQAPIEGLLEVQRDGAGVTATPVSLVPGATKRYTLYIVPDTVNTFAPVFTVTVRLREGRHVLASQTASLPLLDQTSRLLVTATGESAGLTALDGAALRDVGWAPPPAGQEGDRGASPYFPGPGVPGAEGVVRSVHLQPADLPERWNGYEAADLIVLTGAAWAAMNRPQRQAVRRWVETGGRALLCGEQPGEWADPEARELLASLAAPGAWRRAPGSEERQTASRTATSQPGAWRLAPGDAGRQAGFGIVVWAGLDLFRSTVRLSPGHRELWRTLIARATGLRSERARLSDLLDVPAATRAAAELPRVPAPSRPVLVGIAVTYAVIFGPINIRILRRLRRTVKAWLFLPSLAVLMTLVLMLMGQSWGRSRALTNRITITEAMSGAATGWENDLVGLFSPTNRVLDLEAGDPCLALRPEQTEEVKRDLGAGGGSRAAPAGYPGVATEIEPSPGSMIPNLQFEDRSRWERLPLTLWSVQYQRFRRPVDLDGTVAVALQERARDQPAGWVRNGTTHTLARAYLQYHGRRYTLGNLEPGAARRVGSAGWVRRLAARASGGFTPGYASGAPSGRSAPEGQGSLAGGETPGAGGEAPSPSRSEAFSDLYDDASVLLRSGSLRDEAVLVAEVLDLRVPMVIEGIVERARASLLIVRAPVGR
jgi:hypothetical protein